MLSGALDDAPYRPGSLLIGRVGSVLLQLGFSSHRTGERLVIVDPHLHLKLFIISFSRFKKQKKELVRNLESVENDFTLIIPVLSWWKSHV